MWLELYIPSVPVAQPRVKASSFGGNTKVYTPTTVKQSDGTRKPHPIVLFKATVRLVASQKYTLPPLDEPLSIDCEFVFPRQKCKVWKRQPMPRYRHTTKPDRDNLDKAVLDALKGIVFVDDCQVCDGVVRKWHASGDEQPHCRIVIRTFDDLALES